jgi:hypothetical protein
MNTGKAMISTFQRTHPAAAPSLLAAAAVAGVLEDRDAAPDGLARVDAELRHEMIARAAYYIAEQRGFAPGHEFADWCAAEAAVDASLRGAARRPGLSGSGAG